MQTTKNVLLGLLLVIGLAKLGSGQTVGQCVDALVQARSAGDGCSIVDDYLRCLFKTEEFINLQLTAENISLIETQLNAQFSANGLNCVFDVEKIFAEVQAETNGTNTDTTIITLAGYEDALTLGECIDVLRRRYASGGGVTCADVNPYVKCVIRVLEFDEDLVNSTDVQLLKEDLETGLRRANLNCDVDVQSILDDLNGLTKSTTSATTNTDTITDATTTTDTITTDSTTTTTIADTTTTPTTTTTTVSSTTASSTTNNAAPTTTDCISQTTGSCTGRFTGDYPACAPECQEGVYISCVYGQLVVRECPVGWYFDGEFVLAKLVYDPVRQRCDYTSASCPRALDSQVL